MPQPLLTSEVLTSLLDSSADCRVCKECSRGPEPLVLILLAASGCAGCCVSPLAAVGMGEEDDSRIVGGKPPEPTETILLYVGVSPCQEAFPMMPGKGSEESLRAHEDCA